MTTVRANKLIHELMHFLRENHSESVELCSIFPVTDDEQCDLVIRISNQLDSFRLKIALLDRIIRRKSLLCLCPEVCKKVTSYLSGMLPILKRQCLIDQFSSVTDLCGCAQLMTYCLLKAAPCDQFDSPEDELYSTLESILSDFTSIDCLIACSILLMAVIRCQLNNSYVEFMVSCMAGARVDESQCTSSYYRLAQKTLTQERRSGPKLALVYAFIGSLTPEEWLCSMHCSTPVSHVILDYSFGPGSAFASSPKSSLETPTVLFLAKICQIWSLKNKNSMSSQTPTDHDGRGFQIFSYPVVNVFNFCFEIKCSSIAVVRHCCLDTLENLVIAHLQTCTACRSVSHRSERTCSTVLKVMDKLSPSSWHLRGALSMFSRFVMVLFRTSSYSADWLFKILTPKQNSLTPDPCSFVAQSILQYSSDDTLATYVSDLYSAIAAKLSEEDPNSLKVWLDCLVQKSASLDSASRTVVTHHILPKLVASDPKSVVQLVKCCLADDRGPDIPLLLTCYRLIAHCKQKNKKLAGMQLPSLPDNGVLETALICSDLQTRSHALQMLVSNVEKCKNDSKLVSLLNMFSLFLTRDQWMFKRASRLEVAKAVFAVTKRVMELEDDFFSDDGIKPLSELSIVLVNLAAVLLRSFYPGVPPPRLSAGTCWLFYFITAVLCTGSSDMPPTERTPRLMLILREAAHITNDIRLPYGMLSKSVAKLSNHHDPPNHNSNLCSRLFVGLTSGYEEDREYTLKSILLSGLSRYLKSVDLSKIWSETLSNFASSPKPDVSPLAWHLLRLVINSECASDSALPSPECGDVVPFSISWTPSERAIHAVLYLLGVIRDQIRTAEEVPIDGLLAVAANKPFYAMLSCIRALLSDYSSTCIDEVNSLISEARKWSQSLISHLGIKLDASQVFGDVSKITTDSIASQLIDYALRISKLILPVLAHASPEGLLLENEDDGAPSVDFTESGEIASKADEARKYPEYLTICCWRSVRELSDILGVCLPRIGNLSAGISKPTDDTKDAHLYFTAVQLQQISEFFCTQLLCGRHRGGVEQCSLAFVPFCQSLLSCRDQDVQRIPQTWLENILIDLLDDRPDSHTNSDDAYWLDQINRLPLVCLQSVDESYCVTRRSAGLPLFIENILAAYWITRCSDASLVTSTLNRLMQKIDACLHYLCADRPVIAGDYHDISAQRCIVAINIVRTLMRSSTLVQPTASFIESAICMVIDGLGCSDWAVRNCSGLLFSTLFERIFGVSRSRGLIDRKNCLSSSSFFKRYSTLKTHLEGVIASCTADLDFPDLSRTKLYACLLLLARLLPPDHPCEAMGLLQSTFGRHVIRCAASCDIRIRQAAARSVACLVHPSRLPTVIREYIKTLVVLTTSRGNSNFVHGLLLQLQQLFSIGLWSPQDKNLHTDEMNEAYSDRSSLLRQFSGSLSILADSQKTGCPMIRKVFMAIAGLDASLPLDPRDLLHRGLNLEATETHVRLFVSKWFENARRSYQIGGISTDQCYPSTFVHFIKSLESEYCRSVGLRQILLSYHSHTSEFEFTRVYDQDEEDIQALSTLPKLADSGFLKYIGRLIGYEDLFCFLQSVKPEGCGVQTIRYGAAVLSILIESTKVSNELRSSSHQWAYALGVALKESSPSYLLAYVPSVMRLLVVLRGENDSISSDCPFHLCLIHCKSKLNPSFELRQCLLYAIQSIILDGRQWTDGLLYLVQSLLNIEEPDSQEVACEVVQSMVDRSHSSYRGSEG
ncbi:unnamed protein product [Calicophoron daubneyi]|uniref:DUF2428 domain-containing protein n=1 Tax=Calicophoron daubneyi TaxID=300641 RepID=A0AAV2THP4_CALDB